VNDDNGVGGYQSGGANRILIGAGVITVLILLVSGIIIATAEPEVFDPASPEGVVQTYFTALADGDLETAEAMLTPELVAACKDRQNDDNRFPPEMRWPTDQRILLDNVMIRGDRAEVEIRIVSHNDGGPFDVDRYEYTEIVVLTRSAGNWRITNNEWGHWCF